MPAFVKTDRDEHLWSKAKAQVEKEYPDAEGDRYWKLVNGIYQKMSGNKSLADTYAEFFKGEAEHAERADPTKNKFHKTLTMHGFVPVSTTHKQNPFAKQRPEADYTEHIYTHPGHGKSRVIVTQHHGATSAYKNDPDTDWRLMHVQDNGIVAPTIGSTRPQLHKTLVREYGEPAAKSLAGTYAEFLKGAQFFACKNKACKMFGRNKPAEGECPGCGTALAPTGKPGNTGIIPPYITERIQKKSLTGEYRQFMKGLGIGFQAGSSSSRPSGQGATSNVSAPAVKAPVGGKLSVKRKTKLSVPKLSAGLDGMKAAAKATSALKHSLADAYTAHLRKGLPDPLVLVQAGTPRLRTRPLRASSKQRRAMKRFRERGELGTP